MEEELNYLSEKVQDLENQIDYFTELLKKERSHSQKKCYEMSVQQSTYDYEMLKSILDGLRDIYG